MKVARSGKELFYLDWFEARGVQLDLATEDGAAVGAASDPPEHPAAVRATAAVAAMRVTSLREFRTIAACFQSSLCCPG